MLTLLGGGQGQNDEGINLAFEFTVQTDNAGTSAADQFTIPITSATPYDISTSDGHNITGATGATTLTFSAPGTYTVSITDSCEGWQFNNGGDKLKLLDISNWGVFTSTVERAFYGCSNMTCSAIEPPLNPQLTCRYIFAGCVNFNGAIGNWDVSSVTDFSFCFNGCSSFDQNISNWDVSSATVMPYMFSYSSFNNGGDPGINNWNTSNVTGSSSMNHMFRANTSFNQPIGNWDVSGVTRFNEMFHGATSFNQDIGSWNTSAATDMSQMLRSANSFNQNIGAWDTSAVTNMSQMFAFTNNFNNGGDPSINNWNTSNVTSMQQMFYYAVVFNQPIGNWDVSLLTGTGLLGMFDHASIFNQDLSTWNVTSNITSLSSTFNNARVFNSDISGWDVSGVTNMASMFIQAYDFNQDISGWNTSNVVTFNTMFRFALDFNQPIGSWNTSSATNMNAMLENTQLDQDLSSWDINQVTLFGNFKSLGASLSTANYDALLVAWEAQVPQSGITISFGNSQYTLGSAAETARTSLINTYGWTITDGGGIVVPFTFTVDTTQSGTSASDQFTIPTTGTGYNYDVVTSDGQTITGNTGNTTITFPAAGTYDIEITGDFPRIYFNDTGDKLKLTDIKKWGSIVWSQLSYAFKGCANMTMSATDAPNLTQLQTIGGAQVFWGCSSFNSSIDHWDVSTINYMWGMFRGCTSFNQDLNSWDVSNVVEFQQIFENCTAFNGDITSWNIGNASFRYMFRSAVAFNQDISGWDVSGVSTMESMFNNADSFNQNLSSWSLRPAGVNMSAMFANTASFNNVGQPLTWDTSSVTNMGYMFQSAIAFNQPINTWNTSSVTFMSAMFNNASLFNQPLDNWDVSNVTQMPSMFEGATSFNQDISGWNTSSCQSMISMFRNASAFNYSIDSWNTSSVTNMSRMFQGATSFNHPLDNLDISNLVSTGLDWIIEAASSFNSTLRMLSTRPSNITRYAYVFRNLASFNQDVSYVDFNGITQFVDEFYQCPSFDQSLAAWDISTIASGRILLSPGQLSTANYDATLVSWESQAPSWSASMNFGTSKYTLGGEAEAARTSLINTYGWTITDGGGVAEVAYEYEFQPWFDNIHTITTDPAYTYNYNVTVSTGETFTNQTGNLSITFADRTIVRTLQITGLFPATGPYVTNGPRLKYRIINWGSGLWRSLNSAFEQAVSLTDFGPTVPNLQLCTSMDRTFVSFPFAANIATSNLNSWDVSNVTSMQNCFQLSTGNQNLDISGWNTKSLTNAFLMFSQSQFNGDITNWDVSSLTNAAYMFDRATLFNQDIGGWDVSSVEYFRQMFYSPNPDMSFNQDISGWDTSGVNAGLSNNMRYMLGGLPNFNYDLSGWDVTGANDLTGFLALVTDLSRANYDAILIGWAAQSVRSNLTVSFNTSQYTLGGAAEAARNTLINTYNWTITDGGGVSPFTGLLDTYTGASAAYSLRDLSSSTTNVVRVRRSSDNTEQDFTSTQVTDGTLTTFVGAGNDGFVTVWYDQSGNSRNTIQATPALQPQIVSSGALILVNGLPTVDFNNGPYLETTQSFHAVNDASFALAGLQKSGEVSYGRFASTYFFDGFWLGRYAGNQSISGGWQNAASTPAVALADNTMGLMFLYRSGADSFRSVNGSTPVSQTSNSNVTTARPFIIGESWSKNAPGTKQIYEMVLWDNNQSANQSGIESNINSYYTIYNPYEGGLVASYNFDSDFSDYTGNHPLTAFGNATAGVTGGKVSNCLEVDGVDDYSLAVDSDDFSFTNGSNDLPFSISLWANADTLGTGNLVQKRATTSLLEYQVFILSSQIVVNLFSGGSTSNQLRTRVFDTYSTGVWYHITVTYDGSGNNSGLKVYVNGSLPTQTLDPLGTYTGMANTTSPFTIGSYASGVDDFDGKIDEVHVWKNRELTSAEVLDIYNTENAGNSIL